MTVFLLAANGGDPEVIKLLIDYGADVNAAFGRESAIYLMLRSAGSGENALKLAKMMVEAGLDFDRLPQKGSYNPLELNGARSATAARYLRSAKLGCAGWGLREFFASTEPATVRECMDNGLDANELDADGYSSLHLIAKYDMSPALMEAMLKHGGDYRQTTETKHQLTPVHLAARYALNADLLRLFYEHDNRSLSVRSGELGRTPMHLAARNRSSEPLKYMIENGVSTDSTDDDGMTPLHLAVLADRPENIQIRIDAGADVFAKDEKGRQAVHFAVQTMSPRDIRISLVKNGADWKAIDFNGNNALHYAALTSNADVVQYFITLGVSDAARNRDGNTPLHVAARYGKSSEVIMRFLAFNTRPARTKNRRGLYPADLARLWSENIYETDAYWTLNEARFE
ncbi:ankyrin repeat domain-containing protein [Roseovarius amoyensis]|uniref:ankyrin repeat domain-containing protein n=1 Tax=Roseovarius amoyensis TaxID=2211448 RepID=UPI0013A6B0BF|nr:ankyrin repeat domain-containing protein [Roseovarius amoyensis]